MDAVSSVLEKLADPLIKEALFLYGVSDEVEWLQDELQWMQRFLIDAEAKRRGGNEVIKHWLRKVREAAHKAEDIIDTFTLETQKRKVREVAHQAEDNIDILSSGLLQCFKWMERFLCCLPSELIYHHNFGMEIKGLKDKIEHIKKSRTDYNLIETTPTVATASAADEAIQARRRIYAHLNDTTRVVGLKDHTQKIVDQLLDTSIEHRFVVSIVGIGGLGKTTLANNVYNDSKIKAKFDVSACISVSEDYKVQEIYKELARQMMGKTMAELQSYAVVEQSEMLRKFLAERRYLIVLDDVWSPDVCDRLMREALPEVHNGSRVLLTTRNTDLAKSIDRTIPPYELPFLSEVESWALFLNKAFLPDETCSGELETIGRRLVKRCGGLPLALEVLGGILSAKEPNSVAWTSVAEHFDWVSTPKGGDCSKILGLSYDNLPHHHLKSCFLYLGVFPEDSEIKAQQLIELWIAEGFIPQLETQLMEDTAHAYLEELANRSMIQVVEKDWLGSSVAGIRTLKIHDLFRDLCIREAREEDLFNIYNTNSSTTLQDSINNHGKYLRRLVVHGVISTTTINADLRLPPNLKSILQFGSNDYEYPSIIIPDGLKLLRVIHLIGVDNTNVEKFPEIFDKMIENMWHLRYIRFSYEFEFLPPCIQNLSNLQTLHLGTTSNATVLPDWLGEIRTLRHLYLNCYEPSSVSCLGDVGSLTNLQTLDVTINVRELMKHGLEKLLNIRILRVSKLNDLDGEEQLRVFIDSLRKMKYLSELTVVNSIIPTELLSGLSENTHLRYLVLDGPIMSVLQPVPERLQHGFRFPPNLTTLLLMGSELPEDPMATLEKLPYLRVLLLQYNSYKGKEMVCTSGGFPQLQELGLFSLNELEEWRVEDGAMPNLIDLLISSCSNLKTLPEGMQHLRSIRALHLDGYPKDRVRPEVGEDWYKIKHVPQINIIPTDSLVLISALSVTSMMK